MSQDRPDLSVASRLLSQHMARPNEGVVPAIKRVIRYLRGQPCCKLVIPVGDGVDKICIWSDSDWAGDVLSRKSTSGGVIKIGGTTVAHWSKLQSNVALSSGEAELNASVKALSEGIGFIHLYEEIFSRRPEVVLHVDASACKGMLLRHGVGKLKHLSTKQLWVQGAIGAYSIRVVRIPRAHNVADALTHSISGQELAAQLARANYYRS